MAIKNLGYFVAFCCLVSWGMVSCQDPFADKLFDPADSHVRFEYWGVPFNQQRPSDEALDSARIDDGEAIPAVISTVDRSSEVTADFTLSTTGGLTRGVNFELVDGAGNPTSSYSFAPQVFYDSVFFEIIDTVGIEGKIVLELSAVSDENLNLGMPGPLEARKRFTILINLSEE